MNRSPCINEETIENGEFKNRRFCANKAKRKLSNHTSGSTKPSRDDPGYKFLCYHANRIKTEN